MDNTLAQKTRILVRMKFRAHLEMTRQKLTTLKAVSAILTNCLETIKSWIIRLKALNRSSPTTKIFWELSGPKARQVIYHRQEPNLIIRLCLINNFNSKIWSLKGTKMKTQTIKKHLCWIQFREVKCLQSLPCLKVMNNSRDPIWIRQLNSKCPWCLKELQIEVWLLLASPQSTTKVRLDSPIISCQP